MKSYTFWDITPCSPLKVKSDIQGSRISKARNQREIRSQAEPKFFVRYTHELSPLEEQCVEFGVLATVVMNSSSFCLPHLFTMVS
jgi:hypothetical protein